MNEELSKMKIATSKSFTSEEQERYKRHFVLSQVGLEGQVKIKNAKILLIGAGGLGCPIAIYLAAAGIGELTVIDHDSISLSNLQRQILFHTQDLGKPKVEILKERLEAINPNVKLQAIHEKFAESNAIDLIREHDFVIDGTDNFEARYLVNDCCVQIGKSFVFGAIYRFDAQISVFNFEKGPCYRCLYPEAPPLEAVSNCSEVGVLGTLAGTVGTMMASEALKLVLGIGESLSGSILIFDSLRAEITKRKLNKRPDCSACGTHPRKLIKEKLRIEDIEYSQIDLETDFFIVDVRNQDEFEKFHLKEANHIPLSDLKKQILKIPRDQKLLLVCKSGKRSYRAAEILTESGYSSLYQLRGGMDDIEVSLKSEVL